MEQQQQNVELNLAVVSKMLGDKDIAMLSLQSMLQKVTDELKRVSDENKILKEKLDKLEKV